MISRINISGREYEVDLNRPQSLTISFSPSGPRAWYVPPMRIEPVRNEHFTGSVAEGGDVNFRDIYFNPHGHGTHTESVGHITKDGLPTIAETLTQFWFIARLVTIAPEVYQGQARAHMKPGDLFIRPDQIADCTSGPEFGALIVRTLPNDTSKIERNYSDTNPPYFDPDTLSALRKAGIKHLLTDLPSVDRENDEGLLLGHRAWWGDSPKTWEGRTITEMIFVPDHIEDGWYLLNLQVLPWDNDASPSNPVIYKLK